MAKIGGVQEVRRELLRPYENNAKIHSKSQVKQIAESIKEFGFLSPCLIDKDYNIIRGHGRVMAREMLGMESVPCVFIEGLTETQRKAYILADNRLTELGEWDFDKVQIELKELEDLDFNIELTGFEIVDDEPPIDIVEDDFSEDVESVRKTGDIWKLGRHTLMCGDSTDREQVRKLMNGKQADMFFTDPPYNVNITQKKKKILHCNEYNELENDNLSSEDYQEFLNRAFKNVCDNLKDDGSYYVFSCQGGDSEMMMMMMRENGIKCRHQIIWVKDSPVFSMGRLDYDYKHEPILYGWKNTHHFYRKGEQDKSVWEFPRTEKKLHPTMKPVELIANALMNSSQKGDVILDLFGGSGSTLIACEQLDRECLMMEIDPHYVDVIIQRWENLTGQKAVRING